MTNARPEFVCQPRCLKRLLILLCVGLLSQQMRAGADDAITPISVGNRVCLFLDERFVAEQSGLKRTWHPGRPRNEVAIQATELWEKWPHLFGSQHERAARNRR